MNTIKNFWEIISPPSIWRFPVIIILGVLTALVFLVLHFGKADSYLSDNSETCINCHVMYPQYSTWRHSSHARVANCNDCHVPHNNFVSKFLFKASDGLRHSFMFTFRLEPQVIKIKNAGREVVQGNCERCHESYLGHLTAIKCMRQENEEENERLCRDCHQETPHGKVSSLSSFPHTLILQQENVIPDWLKNKILNK